MTQQVKVCATKPDNLSLIPIPKRTDSSSLSCDFHICEHAQNKWINVKFNSLRIIKINIYRWILLHLKAQHWKPVNIAEKIKQMSVSAETKVLHHNTPLFKTHQQSTQDQCQFKQIFWEKQHADSEIHKEFGDSLSTQSDNLLSVSRTHPVEDQLLLIVL